MRVHEILVESRGVSARRVGDTYVNVANPADVLTVQNIMVLPLEGAAYNTQAELDRDLKKALVDGKVINDNNKNAGSRAAIVVTVTNAEGEIQHHIRYIQSIPAAGVNGLWKTIKGYQYSKGAATERVPIKPADILVDEHYRTATELANAVVTGVRANTNDAALISTIDQAVKLALAGKTGPIKDGKPYFEVLQKYASEYLGPIGIISGGFDHGNTQEIVSAFGVKTLKGSKVKFPQNKAQRLIDSVILTPENVEIQVSSKIKTGGGAASSLDGVLQQIDSAIGAKYPRATRIIELLATKSQVVGPLSVAVELGIINQKEFDALYYDIRKNGAAKISDLPSENLRQLASSQKADIRTPDQKASYRVFFHVMTAIVNQMVKRLNQDKEFAQAIEAALHKFQYIQILTKGKVIGNDVFLDYFTKFSSGEVGGTPMLYNKTYMSTGLKGRIGFKLK